MTCRTRIGWDYKKRAYPWHGVRQMRRVVWSHSILSSTPRSHYRFYAVGNANFRATRSVVEWQQRRKRTHCTRYAPIVHVYSLVQRLSRTSMVRMDGILMLVLEYTRVPVCTGIGMEGTCCNIAIACYYVSYCNT